MLVILVLLLAAILITGLLLGCANNFEPRFHGKHAVEPAPAEQPPAAVEPR